MTLTRERFDAEILPRITTDAAGLLPAVVQDDATGDVLMVAWQDAEALYRTLSERRGWYFSRSRGRLWRKGETSGHTQRVVAASLDCDGDTVLLRVQQTGPACHTGGRSCFTGRELPLAEDAS